jgi:hypothetical protein
MEKKSIAKWQCDTADVIRETLTSLAEGLTGIAASDRKDLAFSVGHIFQSLRKGQFLSRLLEEWNSYRAKGRIRDDYVQTEQHQACLQELLLSLDHDCPDEIRFQTLKNIFLVAATEAVSDRTSLLPYQYLRLCRNMSSGEIIVLNATHKIAKQPELPRITGANQWLDRIVKESGLVHTSLVEIHEDELMRKHLLSGRFYGDRSGVEVKPHFRLTTLGFELCEYIAHYEQVSEDTPSSPSRDATTPRL